MHHTNCHGLVVSTYLICHTVLLSRTACLLLQNQLCFPQFPTLTLHFTLSVDPAVPVVFIPTVFPRLKKIYESFFTPTSKRLFQRISKFQVSVFQEANMVKWLESQLLNVHIQTAPSTQIPTHV